MAKVWRIGWSIPSTTLTDVSIVQSLINKNEMYPLSPTMTYNYGLLLNMSISMHTWAHRCPWLSNVSVDWLTGERVCHPPKIAWIIFSLDSWAQMYMVLLECELISRGKAFLLHHLEFLFLLKWLNAILFLMFWKKVPSNSKSN